MDRIFHKNGIKETKRASIPTEMNNSSRLKITLFDMIIITDNI